MASANSPVAGARRPPEPGAVARMSLHLFNNVKEPDQHHQARPKAHPTNTTDNHPTPILSTGGTAVRPCWRPTRQAEKPRPHRVGEAPYMDTSHTRQSPLCTFLSVGRKLIENSVLRRISGRGVAPASRIPGPFAPTQPVAGGCGPDTLCLLRFPRTVADCRHLAAWQD